MKPATIGVLLAVVLAAGCGGDKSGAGGMGTLPAEAPATVTLVPHDRLASWLPQVDGWQRDQPTSGRISLPAAATNAAASYSRGESRVDIEITDSGGAAPIIEGLITVAGSDFTQQASNGYMKGTTVEGVPAVVSWNHVDKAGDLTLLVNRRFVIHASGTGLDRVETLQDLVTRVDLRKIEAVR